MISLEKVVMGNKVRSSGANLWSPSMPGFILLAKKSTDFLKKEIVNMEVIIQEGRSGGASIWDELGQGK